MALHSRSFVFFLEDVRGYVWTHTSDCHDCLLYLTHVVFFLGCIRGARVIHKYISGLRAAENAALARGYALALGVLPRKLAGGFRAALCNAQEYQLTGLTARRILESGGLFRLAVFLVQLSARAMINYGVSPFKPCHEL